MIQMYVLNNKRIASLTLFIKFDLKLRATSGAGISYPTEALDFIPCFSGVRFARSLAFCLVLCRFVVCPFSFGHCVVCPSFYGFRLPF
jgi:hypothetical protein